ncbi:MULTISPECIES: NAD-dependent succinate-semialdehyde dehydrogenase [unclassified Herbaspirillum]|uniref:NAD-dependent succinate-semialdehyde dehydrogenase n=1 Tax=unclassified Herbaspirillum TaxID=2624150 RepID=UPI000E2F041E|nr:MULTISPECIES: NAD-dependent succinate-semialdehyde dehydrogenase [unclassified Herbaspirillum]RFB68619.1 NAD-dependent succinate-semialdehyde dehydrogenase [Herbaspirillum sp. 3R-3a1]TFI05526.1 NAD-dependent succinate-semialdehyde dehydrogenase [Herbaspirillum sp. 3R11]TFI13564.1 NAD-dependent succinate-semialdehyde dehydrogenase [Herbaspirillum sp. 3R-11]TFI25506.1 NAD-dependent succinate-semialdehyde dehydrogenase [Herbaspirillum sp. 3C11]
MNNYPEIQFLINGNWIHSAGKPIINPADESVIGSVPMATPLHLELALQAADAGFHIWKNVAPAKRAEIMLRACDLMRERVKSIATAITLEQGKTLAQARAEVLRGCDLIAWDANEGRRLYGRLIPAEPEMRHTVFREPVGVVAAFTPWNFPLSSPARKVGGALAAGCSIILKAAEETPAGALMLARAFTDAGLPPGVLNLVFGDPAQISEILICHPLVRLVTFTGSTAVGKHLAAMAARHMKPAIMELGGHAPVIVCEDANPELAATVSLQGKLNNGGQVCVAPTRFFVHRAVYDRFVAACAAYGEKIRVGDGMREDVQIGPVTNIRRVQALDAMVDDALLHGARIVCGGKRLPGAGYHFPFTVLADVPVTALAMREEPFGPLCLVTPVEDIHDAIRKANDLPFGLAGYAFTESANHAHRLACELEVGNLAINHMVSAVSETPFGGVKDSGYGREGGTEGLEHYTHVKSVSHKLLG